MYQRWNEKISVYIFQDNDEKGVFSMGKRATWSTARLLASLLFIFCLAFTVATKMILVLSFLFGVLVLVDILLLFFNLILVLVSGAKWLPKPLDSDNCCDKMGERTRARM
jgi:hypothetical protein